MCVNLQHISCRVFNSVTVAPSGKYAYVANDGSCNVLQYTIGADGGLIDMSVATVIVFTNPRYVVTVGTFYIFFAR
jgi:hypothetical protein